MLSPDAFRVLIAVALLLHGAAHAIALGPLIAQSLSGPSPSRLTVRSWILPRLQPKAAAAIALPFWGLSTAGFLAAGLSLLGILDWGDAWRQLALAGSIVSILGIGLFSGMWPGSPSRQRSILNTAIALIVDAAILVTQLVLHWPPASMFGS